MATVIILPKQGQSVESCIITEIKKKKGDVVKKGEILFSYETDKASFEEESPVDGVVLESFYNDGDEVAVLLDMMVIGQPGEEAPLTPPEGGKPVVAEPVEKAEEPVIIKEVETKQMSSTPLRGAGGLSPRAKNLATAEAFDASQLAGSGPNGRVIEKDVLAALENRPKLTPLAKKIAAEEGIQPQGGGSCLLYTSPSPRDRQKSRMPSSA